MVWSIFKYENNFVSITKENIKGIPCLKFIPKDAKGLLPTVIYYHGWHSSKEFKRFDASIIATNGYQVIVPDALYHGDRDPINHDNPENFKYLWEIISQNIKESKGLLKEIINKHNADPEKIGILGESMGAISAAGAFIENSDLKCFVGIHGSYTWQDSINNNELPPVDDNNKEFIELYNPMNNFQKLKGRSLLILHGDADTTFSINTQKSFYKELLPLYKDRSDSLQFIEATNVNHRVTTGMLERAVIWFKEHL